MASRGAQTCRWCGPVRRYRRSRSQPATDILDSVHQEQRSSSLQHVLVHVGNWLAQFARIQDSCRSNGHRTLEKGVLWCKHQHPLINLAIPRAKFPVPFPAIRQDCRVKRLNNVTESIARRVNVNVYAPVRPKDRVPADRPFSGESCPRVSSYTGSLRNLTATDRPGPLRRQG